MAKRYQVFISSTFEDLKAERQAVLKAVLELDHMPAGMELFPAADDSAWQLIKDVIDASDYYTLIIGGRYGSLDEAGIGYTEKEYDYAVESGKPVIPLLHENPDNLPRDRTETDKSTWEKLKQFRQKVEDNHTCVYWNSPDDLKAKVIVGLTNATKRNPGVGWIRADKIPGENILSDMLELRKKNEQLEAQLEAQRIGPPKGTEELVQGDDEFEIKCKFEVYGKDVSDFKTYSGTFIVAWNDIWGAIAPTLINEATERQFRGAIKRFFSSRAKEIFSKHENFEGLDIVSFKFSDEDIDTCIVQLRALGLMRESLRQRSVKDTNTYWTLTSYGDNLMVQLRAIRKKPKESKPSVGHSISIKQKQH
jgi:hypothetical protein